jgi:acyl-CoA synthetase (AMP-forming)/AMP-acid ligase II/acyl carrier protein
MNLILTHPHKSGITKESSLSATEVGALQRKRHLSHIPDRASTLPELLGRAVATRPDGIALIAPGRPGLTYRELAAHAAGVQAALIGFGLGREDRVALVLPNGPEMATAFLGVACSAVCAPLNPDYRAEELDFYLSDLGVQAVVVEAGSDSPARAAASSRGIEVLELASSYSAAAGAFSLSGSNGKAANSRPAEGADIALLLHTSGTTSRPKLVPLLHRNLCASADNVARMLGLSPDDCCLSVMPLFHIHGLVAALLSSLAVGGSVVCAGSFSAPRFFSCLEMFRPTWYTAVPTMHQAVLAHAAANAISNHRLRFIRSSSAALPAPMMAELEALFGVPVIEAYGMTEAAHQMASNPLPPARRKPRSVGIAAGPEIAIADGDGALLPSGQSGEVVIRGANVTPGYENNAPANRASFTDGWFRTGDQGYLDDDGYLFLTGRLKEIINRGGEKVSPREIDEALLEHPAVAQAVAFAVPHPTLGEDVAAAVVLREGTSADPPAVRAFLFDRLTDSKVPSQVVIVPAIPKGPTGKLQRIGLADQLREFLQVAPAAPRNAIEDAMVKIFAEVLRSDRFGIDDNFFALGGDSLRAAQVTARLYSVFGVELYSTVVFQRPTVAELADEIAGLIGGSGDRSR